MKKFLQILAILTLFTWGSLFLHFYATGRIEKYLDPDFRIYALISGIGMILLGTFNFIHRNRETGGCGHDHAEGGCCGHDDHDGHSHEEEHEHHHHEGHACDHDHGHSHAHSHECDHEHHHHDHGCDHGKARHAESTKEHDHVHDHEDTPSGVAFSLIILLLPLLVATGYSKDKFSSDYLAKWGKIERQMMQMRIARDQSSGTGDLPAVGATDNPYTREGIAASGADTADTPPEPKKDSAESGAAEAWGTFTIEDLKKMVPQNDKGEFLLDVPQIFYTAGDKELMEVMEGIPVETTAQLMEETLNNPNKTRLKAFRLFIECCAADARPLSIPVDFGKAPPTYTEMGWYKLYGKLHYAKENGEIIPLLQIEKIESTTEPTDGLLF